MATTSTVPAVIDGLLEQAESASFEAWPGIEGAATAGRFLKLGEVTWTDGTEATRIATVKAGRKQRNEFYEIAFELFIMGAAGTSPSKPKAARDEAFAALAEYEDALAEDVTAGAEGRFSTVQWVEIHPTTAEPRVFERGWAYRIAGAFMVHARLV